MPFSSRAFSARNLNGVHLGRWPRLLHFAPLALRTRTFHTVSVAIGFVLVVGYEDENAWSNFLLGGCPFAPNPSSDIESD
jgi:hypothetical protein